LGRGALERLVQPFVAEDPLLYSQVSRLETGIRFVVFGAERE
jgi:hypothetical protein